MRNLNNSNEDLGSLFRKEISRDPFCWPEPDEGTDLGAGRAGFNGDPVRSPGTADVLHSTDWHHSPQVQQWCQRQRILPFLQKAQRTLNFRTLDLGGGHYMRQMGFRQKDQGRSWGALEPVPALCWWFPSLGKLCHPPWISVSLKTELSWRTQSCVHGQGKVKDWSWAPTCCLRSKAGEHINPNEPFKCSGENWIPWSI